MIRASKHIDLDKSVLRISAEILKKLMKYRIMGFDDLQTKIYNKFNNDCDIVFNSSLNFLYLLGCIEYHSNTDKIEFINKDMQEHEN